jgi:dephospho-CoA kinase
MERVRVRSGWSDAQIQARMAQQWTADRVNERADVVITNDGLTPIVPLVFDLLHQL